VTGEITLRGKVLPVGGIKEKILAATRTPGIEYVLLPEQNRPNVQHDLDSAKNLSVKIVYMKSIRDALVHVFGADCIMVQNLDHGPMAKM